MQQKYGQNVYNIENVIISSTHTHGTPGGYMMDLLYDMSTFGFVSETNNALISGIFNVRILFVYFWSKSNSTKTFSHRRAFALPTKKCRTVMSLLDKQKY